MSRLLQPQPFDFETDRFAFANESTWNENEGASVYEAATANGKNGKNGKRRIYRKRCYVMVRSAIQFWKFARFRRDAGPLSEHQVVDRIVAVRRTSAGQAAWPADDRIEFPGFGHLYDFSRGYARLLRSHLGAGWPTYLRPGNLRMAVPPTRRRQQALRDTVIHSLQHATAVPLWLFTFPNFLMTHCVVAFRYEIQDDGRTVFSVYDPNYRSCPKRLIFDPDTQRFEYQRTYFFGGGRIDVASIYPITTNGDGHSRQSASGSLIT